MTARKNALLMAAIMLAVGLAAPASAWHTVPDLELPGQPPQGPDDAPVKTNVTPVDRNMDDAFGRGQTVNQNVAEGYRIVGATLNDVDERTRAAQEQPITLLRDGGGGRNATNPSDNLDGGFGEPTSTGTHQWGHAADAAAQGQQGYTTPRDALGNYLPFSSSLLATPEIDLRTNAFMEGAIEHQAATKAMEADQGARETHNATRGPIGTGCGGIQDTGASNDQIDGACTGYPALYQSLQNAPCAAQGQLCPNVSANVNATLRGDRDVPSTVYHGAYWGCDAAMVAVHTGPVVGAAAQGADTSPLYSFPASFACWTYRDFVEEQEKYISLQFSNRHNLALLQDGVSVMVFSQPPTIAQAQACQPNPGTQDYWQAFSSVGKGAAVAGGQIPQASCVIVQPFSASRTSAHYRGLGGAAGVASMPGGQGFNSYRGWNTDGIDLTPWSGRSVWVGFYFGSGATGGPSYFQDPTLFSTTADFNGFQLDDLVVKSPAAQVNVGVRPLEQPNCVTHLCRTGIPVLDPAEPVHIVASVTNFAVQEAAIKTITRILHASNRTVIETSDPIEDTLPPASYLQRTLNVTGLTIGAYIVQTCVARNDTSPTGGETGFCDTPRAKGDCSTDTFEADPCSRVVEQRIDLFPVRALRTDPIVLGSNSLGSTDRMTAHMTLHNDGNRDQWVEVKPFHVRLDDGEQGDNLLPDNQKGTRTVLVPSRGSHTMQWEISGAPGDYQLIVQTNSVDNAPRAFRAEYDLLPKLLQPWRPSVFPNGIDIDGAITDDDWFREAPAPVDDGQGGTRFQVGNNGTDLFISLQNITSPRFTLFIDDLGDGDLTTGGGGLAVFSNGNVQGFPLQDPSEGWQPSSSVASVAAGLGHSLAIMDDGGVYAWGRGAALGNNGTNGIPRTLPDRVLGGMQGTPFLEDIVMVASGAGHSLALTSGGAVYAWGASAGGALGDGTVEQRTIPVRVRDGQQQSDSDFLEHVVFIDAGNDYSLAVTEDPETKNRTAWAWGENGNGQLGDNTTNDRLTPVRILDGEQRPGSGFLEDVELMDAGFLHAVAVTADGRAYAWGGGTGTGANGNVGELGDGRAQQSLTPVRVKSGGQGSGSGFLENVTAIQAGGAHSLALTESGHVYAWGGGQFGPLGDGGAAQRNEPVRVRAPQESGPGFLEGITSVTAGAGYSMARSTDGHVYTWGSGQNGRLGTGDTQDRTLPTRINSGMMVDVVQVSASGASANIAHSLALTADGATFAWGTGFWGQLGNGATANVLAPEWIPVNDTYGIEGTTAPYPFFVNRQGALPNFQAEIRIPISGTHHLQAGPGDSLGVLLRYCNTWERNSPCASFPRGAPMLDGTGFHPADGDVADEVAQWHTIVLAEPEATGSDFPYAENILSPAFAIGRGTPPPLFQQDFRQCPSMRGWAQTIPAPAITAKVQDKWNCDTYSDDGLPLLYLGKSSDSDCDGPCDPYTGIPDAPPPAAAAVRSLWTPPIDVPANTAEPTLLLSHQYSTEALIEDRLVKAENCFSQYCAPPVPDSQGRIRINHVLTILAEVWNEDAGAFGRTVIDNTGQTIFQPGFGYQLQPTGGFPTEDSTGVLDPRYPPRQYYQNPTCGILGITKIPQCTFLPQTTSWWWPQGTQATYRPLDRDIPVPGAATLHGGSPWTTDHLPLTGTATDGSLLDLRGETVRFRFVAITPITADRSPTADLEDWGWRIGGLALIEGENFLNDLRIESANIDLAFDPFQKGLGPGTSVPVDVVVHNSGRAEASQVRVLVVADDTARTLEDPEREVCSSADSTPDPNSNGEVPGVIKPGEVRSLTVWCDLDPAHADGQISFRTWVERGDVEEDFTGNDNFRVRGHFDLRQTLDATVSSIQAVPEIGPVGEPRRIPILLQNQGNTPLHGATIVLKVFDINDPSRPPLEVARQSWTTTKPLPMQAEPIALEDLVDGLDGAPRFTPRGSGLFIAEATITAPGVTFAQGRASSRLQASDEIYDHDFDNAPARDEDVLEGELDNQDPLTWSIQRTGGVGGSARLVAGNAKTGEIAPGSNASFVLPAVDLGLLKDATLTFRHRYDLEPGYDAARLEVSADGGKTWQPVQPRAQPGNDLPEGYPSVTLMGANSILGDAVECSACAYTGRSADLAGNDDGWVVAEFDLSRHPAFWLDAPIDDFPLRAMASQPQTLPVQTLQGPQFFHDSWALDEDAAMKNQRYWWIDDQTYAAPSPLNDNVMWWSGSAREKGPTGIVPPVHTTLSFNVSAQNWSFDDGDRLVLRYWDWRAGWQNSADGERKGTGGTFLVDALATDGQPATRIVERRADGWTLREMDLSVAIGAPSHNATFRFVSGAEAGLKNNHGWFIDSATFVRQAANGTEATLSRNTAAKVANATVAHYQGDVRWTRAAQGAAATGPSWHIDEATIPGRGQTDVWRLQDSGSVEGYPNNVDSRVVTPVLDLRSYRGDSASLQFDHRYSLAGGQHAGTTIGVAHDAGAVEVQVFDDTTATFGPWQTLNPPGTLPELGFRGNVGLEDPAQLQQLQAIEYPSFAFAFTELPAPTALPLYAPMVQPNDLRIVASAAGPMEKVGGQTDQGTTFPSQNQQARTYWRLQWAERDGHSGFGPGDDPYLLDGTSRVRLAPVTYANYPSAGKTASYAAGTRVEPCDADITHACDGISNNVEVVPAGKGGPQPAPAGIGFLGLGLGQRIRWHDLDGDGSWSHRDTAYLQAANFNSLVLGDLIEIGDLRITPMGLSHPTSARVKASDPDVGASLQPGGLFQFCQLPGGLVYLTTSAVACGSGAATGISPGNAFGSTFPQTNGWTTPASSFYSYDPASFPYRLHPMVPYNYTPVYSGDSGGWLASDIDVTHLIGKQVRFGFHAWTNPSNEPARRSDLHGWSVGNVHIQGQQFQGEPVLLRFRIATDDSMPKGEWSIDDIRITGQRHDNGILVRSDQTYILDEPGQTVTFEGDVRNLGATPRNGLAIAIDASGVDDYTFTTASLATPDPDTVPPQFQQSKLLGPFNLGPGGSGSAALPVRLQLQLPSENGSRAEFRITILEDVRSCILDDAGEATCTTKYAVARNDRGLGLAGTNWVAEGQRLTELRLIPPQADRATELVVDPPVAKAVDGGWQPVIVQAALHNNGTALPDDLTAKWTFTRIDRKGDAQAQRGTRMVTGPQVTITKAIPDIARGDSLPLLQSFTPSSAGLYRVDLRILADGDDPNGAALAHSSTEFLAGDVAPYYAIDFGTGDSGAWRDAPPTGPETAGQTPAAVGFRIDSGRLIWGVNETQFALQGLDYCTADAGDPCNPQTATRTGSPDTIYGLHGIAQGPLVDLGRVVGDRATLSLRHGHVFAGRDGAVVEAMPVHYPVINPPQPAFLCQNAETGDPAPMWFQLPVEPGSALGVHQTGYPGVNIQTGWDQRPSGAIKVMGWTPDRINPVDIDDGSGPLIGGLGVDQEVTRFALHATPTPICPPGFDPEADIPLPSNLVNYTMQLRLRTGTTPGFIEQNGLCNQFNNDCRGPGETLNPPTRTGAMGWQIDSIGMTSVELALHPTDGRAVTLLDGFRKTFNVQVTNTGPLPDTFHIGLAQDDSSSINATWFTFPVPHVSVAPGQTKTVPFEVFIPAGTFGAGTPVAHIQATSGLDPNIFARSGLALQLPENPLPDLWTGLDVETATDVAHPGEVARVFVTVHNIGRRDAEPVPLLIQATLIDGTQQPPVTIATKQLPRLGPDQAEPEAAEWIPKQVGLYRIEAIADPEGKLIQANTANSRAIALVQVVPADRAAVRVTDLSFDGVGPDGYALEGSLITIKATLTNVGAATATGGRAFLWAGSTELTEVRLDAMAPGETRNITALRIASAGETRVRALYLPGTGQEDQHEFSRILRIRGLDLSYEGPTQALALAPGNTITTQVNITNAGNAVEKVLFSMGPLHKDWSIAAAPNPVTVAPNGGASWSILTLLAPPDAAAGTYDVFVHAAPLSSPQAPQLVAIPVTVAPRLDAPEINAAEATSAPGPGIVRVTLESRSNARQDVRLFSEWTEAAYNVTLQAGQNKSVDLPIHIPARTPPGNVSLRIRVQDAGNTILATGHAVVKVLAQESATAAWAGNRTSRTADDLQTRVLGIDIAFSNTGNVPVRPYVVLSRLTPGASEVPADNLTAVQPGETIRVPVAVRVDHESTGTVEGQASVFMEVLLPDGYDVLVAELPLPDLASLPDLAVTDVRLSPPGGAAAGKPLQLQVLVENLGPIETPETTLYAYVNGEVANFYDFAPLEAGQTTQLNLTWTFPTSGDYFIHLVADGDDRVGEIHDDNNGWTQEVKVGKGDFMHQIREAPAPGALWLVLALALVAVGRRQGTRRQ